MESGTMDYVAARYSHNSPLAKKLFGIDGVTRVFYGKDHISVAKQDEIDWSELKPQIYSTIVEYFTAGTPLFTDEPRPEDTEVKDGDSEVVIMIKEILETRVRPVVQEDGGDITYRDFDEKTGTVRLIMKGSCAGCPSSAVTLKNGIEKMLMHYIPEVKIVEATDFEGDIEVVEPTTVTPNS